MRSPLLTLVGLLSLSGCIIHNNESSDSVEEPGNISFYWRIDGQLCSTLTGLPTVHIQVDGPWGPELLRDNGTFACDLDGVTLWSFAPGTYNFEIQALDGQGVVRYITRGSVRVNGNVSVPANLNPANSTGTVNVFWKFDDDDLPGTAPTDCAGAGVTTTAGVTKIVAYLNDEAGYPMACSETVNNLPVEGLARQLAPGTYSLKLEGYVDVGTAQTADWQLWYEKALSFNVLAGETQTFNVTLLPVASGATFVPMLKNGTQAPLAFNCPAGAELLNLYVKKHTDASYPMTPVKYGLCAAFDLEGFSFQYISTANSWDVLIEGCNGSMTACNWLGESLDTQLLPGRTEAAQRVPVVLAPVN